MAEEPAVEVRAKLNTSEAKESAKSLGEQILGSLTPTIDVAALVGKGIGVIKDAFASAAEALKASVVAALDAEAAQVKFAAALKLSGDITGTTLGRLQAYNTELSRKIGIDDDDLAGIQTKLIALGVEKDQLEAATKATLGYAEATGKDALAATKQVAKAFEEGGERAQQLEDMFGIVEARAGTLAGAMRRVENQSSELSEDFGALIIQNASVAESADRVAKTYEHLRIKLAEQDEPIKAVTDATAKTVDVFSSLVTVGAEVYSTALPLITRGFVELVPGANLAGSTVSYVADQVIRLGDAVRSDALDEASMKAFADRIKTLVADKNELDPWGDEPEAKENAAANKRRAREAVEGLMNPKAGTRVGGLTDDQKSAQKEAAREEEKFWKDKASDAMSDQRELADQEKRAAKAKIDGENESNKLISKQLEYKSSILEYHTDRREENQKRLDGIQQDGVDAENKHWRDLTGSLTKGIDSATGVLSAGLGAVQNGLGSFFSGLAETIASGEKINIGHLIGGMLVQMGQAAIVLGGTAVAGGILGTVAPFLAPATGGPAAIAAGAGLIAAGVITVGLGTSLGGGGGDTPSAPASSGGGRSDGSRSSRSPSPELPRGFSRDDDQGGRTTVINVSLGRGVVYGTPRQIGTELSKMIEGADGLRRRKSRA